MKKQHHIALGLITFLVYVFLIGPLLIIMAASFGEQNALVFPGQGFTFKWYAQVLQMNSFIRAALLSLEIAFAATAIALLLGAGPDSGKWSAAVYGPMMSLALPMATLILPLLAADLFGDREFEKLLGIFVSVSTAVRL